MKNRRACPPLYPWKVGSKTGRKKKKTKLNYLNYNAKLQTTELFCGLVFSRGYCFYFRKLQRGLRAWLEGLGKFGLSVLGEWWKFLIRDPGEGRGDQRGTCVRTPAAAEHSCLPGSRGEPRRKWWRRGEWKPGAVTGPEDAEGVGTRPSGPRVGRGWPLSAGPAPTCGPGRQPPDEA